MKLQNHPRLCAALCLAAVLACAAAPAVLLAAADAAAFNTVEAVADPYTAPTPCAEDYYILRQLAARTQNDTAAQNALPETPRQGPKLYIGAAKNLAAMDYADTATAEAVTDTLSALAACGALPQIAVDSLQTPLPDGENIFDYGETNGILYD